MNKKSDIKLLENLYGKFYRFDSFKSLVLTLGSSILIAFSATLLYFAVEQFSLIYQSTTWPSAEGRIYQSAAQELNHSNPTDHIEARSTKTRKGSKWKVDLKYSYQINGEEFKGSNITLTEEAKYFVKLKDAEAFAESFKEKDVPVYYSPDDSKFSVLINELTSIDYMGVSVCVLFLFLGFFGFYNGINYKRNKIKPAPSI